MQIHNVEQNTPEWFSLRSGVPTASAMKQLFTSSHALPKGVNQTMQAYAAELAADKMSGLPLSSDEGFQGNRATERGQELEPVARADYSLTTGVGVERAGFVTNFGAGCSPDGFVGDDGLLEIKCPLAKNHTRGVADIVNGQCPTDYYVQVQAQMWICERDWCDLYYYHPHLPSATLRVHADPEFQKLLAQQTALIIGERDALVRALEKAQ